MPTRLTVKTDVGTFTRSTVRTYTHLVVTFGYRAERIEMHRQDHIASERQQAADYRRILAAGLDATDRSEFERQGTAERIADGSYAKWIAHADAEVARLEARGPITSDTWGWTLDEARLVLEPKWEVLGWCGRLDLAQKLAETEQAGHYRCVRIYDLAGNCVSRHEHPVETVEQVRRHSDARIKASVTRSRRRWGR